MLNILPHYEFWIRDLTLDKLRNKLIKNVYFKIVLDSVVELPDFFSAELSILIRSDCEWTNYKIVFLIFELGVSLGNDAKTRTCKIKQTHTTFAEMLIIEIKKNGLKTSARVVIVIDKLIKYDCLKDKNVYVQFLHLINETHHLDLVDSYKQTNIILSN